MSALPLIDDIKACTVCASDLAHPPRPVLRASSNARVAIVGQAPGAKVHASGVPWDDASGEHLREWLDVDRAAFDDEHFAILPMGFCWPGRRAGGDLPPRPECAPLWHDAVLRELPQLRLILLVGQYAIAHYLGDRRKKTLTETVRNFREYAPDFMPLPHPAWRSKLWIKKNPWFLDENIPALRTAVAR